MKTSKRKRSTKAAPAAEATVVDAVAAETATAQPAADLNAASVEASVAAEPVAEIVSEKVDAAADMVAAMVAESALEPTAETVVAEIAAPAGEPVVVLAANCSVKDAAALKTSLCAVATESTAVTLDVSAVERVDTATMQLLCAFVRDRSGRKQNVTWRGESQALQDAVRLLGVAALLGFDSKGVAA